MKPTDPHRQGPLPPSEADTAVTRHGADAQGAHADEADDLHNEGVAHEHSDVNVSAILSFAGIITVVSTVCALVVWGMFVFFERDAAARDPRTSPLGVPSTQMPPTTDGSPFFGAAQQQPRLLTNEPAALRALRESENGQLDQFGWVDQAGGVARVPIAEAKKLLAERGLPSRPGGADPRLGTNAPAYGEPSGGRTVATRPHAGAPPGDATAPAPSGSPQAPHQPTAHAPAGRGGGA